MASRIARYKLHEDRATPKIRTDYEDAIKFLTDVATFKANVDGAVDKADTTSGDTIGNGRIAVSAPPLRLTDCVMDRMP
jgi:phage gp36-like protein